MMDKNQLKRDGLGFGRALQRAYKIVALYTAEHQVCEEPVQKAYESLAHILKETPQLTFGFFNRRVVLNELVTPDLSLEPLEQEFFRRGIAAVSFALGVTFREFKRGLGLLATKAETIEERGGIVAFLQRNPVEGMRIVPADRRPLVTGDAVLGMDLQSYMMAQSVLDAQPGIRSPSLGMLLQSAGIASPSGYSGTPDEMIDLVTKATQAAWVNSEGDPQRAVEALAKLLEEMSPEFLFTLLPRERQKELRNSPPMEVAAEIAENIAIDWARRHWDAQEQAGGGSGIAEHEVARVLARALQTSKVAERLLLKLATLVESGELPSRITDRIHAEMRWTAYTTAQQQAHLLGLRWFNEQDFRHLVEYIQLKSNEGNLDQVNRVAQHFLKTLDSAGAEARATGMARLQELIQILTGLHTLDFVRSVVDRLTHELAGSASSDPAWHQQIAACLGTAARSLATFEEYDAALQIGLDLERSFESNKDSHAACCGRAVQDLLNSGTIERLLDLSVHKQMHSKLARTAGSLLRLVESQAAEVVFHMLEDERSASSRSRLLGIARQLGEGAFCAARKRLQDPRWYVVRNACFVLGELSDPELCQHLEPVLRHSSTRVQQAAVTALVRSTVAGRGAVLVSALPALPPHLQETVLDELVLLKDSSAIDPLEGLLVQGGTTVKTGVLEKALRALTALPDERVVEVLSNVLMHAEAPQSLRRSALAALKSSPHSTAQQRLNQFRLLAPTDPLTME